MSPFLRRWLPFGLLFVAALVARLPGLDQRPMHTDESINAVLTSETLEGKPFRYDPQDRHGPALFLFTTAVAKLAGIHTLGDMTEWNLRLSAVLTSALVVLAMGLLVRPLGFLPPLLAAAFWVLAPGPLYYGRYLIHESGFVAATVVFLAAMLRWTEHRAWPLVCGLAAGLMLAFKETAILPWMAAGVAFAAGDRAGLLARLKDVRGWIACLLSGLAVVVLLFSWFGADWAGLGRLFDAAVRFTARAGGEGHEKPWHYYVLLLSYGWAGPLLLLAALSACWRPAPATRFLAFYAVAMVGVHMAIPYKTPWLALGLYLPVFLLAGISLARNTRVALLSALLILGLLAIDARRPVMLDPTGELRPYAYQPHSLLDIGRYQRRVNPFAYAHTVTDLLRLPEHLQRWEMIHQRAPRIAVAAKDAWPLPWYLRRWASVGFYLPQGDPPEADIYISDMKPGDAFLRRVINRQPEYFGVREGVFFILYAGPVETPTGAGYVQPRHE